MEQGLVHIYCGDGKGKTTCAFGLALRCAGTGAQVRIAQFLKSGDSGEVTAMQQFDNVELLRAKQGSKFTFQMNAAEKALSRASAARDKAERAWKAADPEQKCDMIILDEIMAACTTGMVDTDELVSLIQTRPPELEVVLTGRNPPQALLDLADYITEMKKIRHPYDKGITARRGIER
mgnify:CR=1 FL=1